MESSSGKKVRSKRRRGAIDRAPSVAKQSPRRQGNRRRAALKLRLPKISLGAHFSAIAKIAIAGGAALAVAGGLELGYRAATRSDSFALQTITVEGATRSTEGEILALAGVERGDNLLVLEVHELEAAIARHPWVARATVSRRLPHTLSIRIEEHAPVALVALSNLYYVDRAGDVVKRYTADEHESLPVITGVTREDIEGEDVVALAQMRAAVLALSRVRAVLGEESAPIEEIHVEPSAGVSVRFAKEDLYVRLGPPPWDEALLRLQAVKDSLAARGVRAREITLGGERRPERVIARLDAPPPSTSRK